MKNWSIPQILLLQIALGRVYFQRQFFLWLNIPNRSRPPHYWGSESTLRHTTLGRNPVDEWSARRRDLYLTTHNTHKRQTSMPSAVFQPAIWESERPQTHALDGAVTGIGCFTLVECSDQRGIKNTYTECPQLTIVPNVYKMMCLPRMCGLW